mgnify:CR=1 FL=1
MRTLGNIIWFILGGFLMGLGWYLVGLIAFISIIGIPWGKACFVIVSFSFFPFGKEPVSRSHNGQSDIGTGALGTVGNIIWFVVVKFSKCLYFKPCFFTYFGTVSQGF